MDWSHRKGKNLIVSGSWDATCKVYDANQLKLLSDHVGHVGVVYSSVWSPHLDDTFASTSGMKVVQVNIEKKIYHYNFIMKRIMFYQFT